MWKLITGSMLNFLAPILKRLGKSLSSVVGNMSITVALSSIAAAFVVSNVITILSGFFLLPELKSKKGTKSTAAITGLKPTTLNKQEIDQIISRNIFNSEGKVGEDDDPKDDGKKEIEGDLIKSDLPLVLVGTIFAGDPVNGIALIEDKSNRSRNTVMVGESLPKHRAEVLEILRERVIFLRDEQKEYIEIEKPELKTGRRGKKQGKTTPNTAGRPRIAPVATSPPPDVYREDGFERKGAKITMDKRFKKQLLGEQLTKVLQDAKATPFMVDGQLRGFKLTKIRQDSIYHKSGFQNNDVITEINGVVLTSASQAIQLLNSLRQASEIEVRGERAGAPFDLFLSVKE